MADAAPPRVRTYHARRGRLSDAHHDALATLEGRWGLQPSGPQLDLAAVFGGQGFGGERQVVLDIGCGMGESTRSLGFLVANLEEAISELEGAGVTIGAAASNSLERYVHFTAPDGHLYELVERL